MAERQLPKLKTRVRFPSPAPVESLDARYAFGAFSITEMRRSRLSRHLLYQTASRASFRVRVFFLPVFRCLRQSGIIFAAYKYEKHTFVGMIKACFPLTVRPKRNRYCIMRRVAVLKAIRFRETDTSVGAAIYEAWYALNKRDSGAKESHFKIYPFHQSCKGVHKMRDVFVLKNEDFCLSLDFQVFQADISSPSNTILSVYIASNGFSAATTMDIDIKQLPVFCNDLKAIYNTLQGEAKIQEPFGSRQYISFVGERYGHIAVSGVLHSNGTKGYWQELKFENGIDQTFLPAFLKELTLFSNPFVD